MVGGRRYDLRHDKEKDEECQQDRDTERDLVAGLRRQPVDLRSQYTTTHTRTRFVLTDDIKAPFSVAYQNLTGRIW